MREIKFKAWDKKYKFMYDNIVTFPAENCNFYYDVSLHPGSYHLPPLRRDLADIIVLQYTGLKDKNGTDIYEGDIVKVNGEIYTNHEVRFEEDEGGYCPLLEFSYVKDEFEVIGTIYENPELLR